MSDYADDDLASGKIRNEFVDGLHMLVSGRDSTPLLFLHGIGSSSRSFLSQLLHWTDRRMAMAWDAPGYGRSILATKRMTMTRYAEAVRGLVSHMAAERVHLVGVSFGGVIATRVALDHPEMLESLVLADTTVGSGSDPKRAAAMLSRPAGLADMGAMAFAQERAPRLLSAEAPASLVERVTREMAEVPLDAYRAAAVAMAETDHTRLLADIAVPTLILVGEKDAITPVEDAERLHSAISGSQLRVVPGAGHLANRERPSEFNAEIDRFITQFD